MTAMPNDELSILEIKRLIVDTRKRIEAFDLDERVVLKPSDFKEAALIDVIFMNVYRVLEEATSLSFELKSTHPEIPWDQVRGMRNRFAHDYAHLDRKTVWLTINDGFGDLEALADSYIEQNGLESEDDGRS